MADMLDDTGVEEVLNYDPFSSAPEEGGAEAFAEAEAAAEATPPAETPAAPVEPPAAETPTEPAPTPDFNQQLLEEIRAMRTVPQPAAPVTPPTPTEEEFPNYRFDINQQLVDAIRSEDPAHARAAIQHIVEQTALAVHRNLRPEYRGHVQNAVESYYRSQVVQTRERDEVRSDFYSRYPEYNTSAGRALVVAAAQEVLAENPTQRYSKDLGDKIAARVKSTVASFAGSPAGGQVPAPAAAAPKKLPAKPPQTTRPTTRPPTQSPNGLQADVLDTLFGKG